MIYYRISDKSYPKIKLPGATKWACWCNFREVFGSRPVEVVLDNCDDSTIDLFEQQGYNLHKTANGNAGSLRYCLDMAAARPPDDMVYFVEDDYLHLSGAYELIMEGLQIADYVTIYDHPDKYSADYGFGETSKVMKTRSAHWRFTVSTCMTFASTAKTIAEDRKVWEKHTKGAHPHDHEVFMELGQRGRKLAVCIPGRACHCDPTWGGFEAIEPWAIHKMLDQYRGLVMAMSDPSAHAYKSQILSMQGVKDIDKLKMLHAVLNHGDQ